MLFKVLYMHQQNQDTTLETLRDIHSIMERSARFMSLSGWSGVWAGCTALVGAAIAKSWLANVDEVYYDTYQRSVPITTVDGEYQSLVMRFVTLAMIVLVVALAGGYYFTMRKAKRAGGTVWNHASRRMLVEIAIPLAAGGIFASTFLFRGLEGYIPATCLVFYGLALINGSKYTLSDIKFLGLLEVVLGCICLFAQGYGLLLWTIGFGALHILYGIMMWNKYDKQQPGK